MFRSIAICFIAMSQFCWSQIRIEGVVSDTTDKPADGAIIRILADDNSTLEYAVSDEKGQYNLHLSANTKTLIISVGLMGYNTIQRTIENKSQICNFTLTENYILLKEVVVKAPAITIRGDTLTYNLLSYSSRGDYTLKDALKKLPGIDVSDKGKIRYLGKDISNFYIEGLDLLGGQYNIATTNIPAEYVNSVQVLNNHQSVKMNKDIFSDDIAINLKMNKKAKLKPVGSSEVSVGYGDKWLYQIGGAAMLFKPKFQTIASAKLGNTSNFAEDEAFDHLSSAQEEASLSEKIMGDVSASAPPVETDRYAFPTDRLMSVNTINKLTEESTLKANARYAYSKYRYEYGLLRNYYDGKQNIILSQQMQPESSLNKSNLSVQYEKNASTVYIKNNFASWVSIMKSEIPTTRDEEHSSQKQSLKGYNLQNDFGVSWLMTNLRWNISSFLRFTDSPNGEITISDGSNNITQKSNSSDFASKTKLSATYSQGKNRLYLPLSFDFFHQKVNTLLDVNPSENTNNNSLNNLQITFSPQYEYASPIFVLRTSVAFRNNFVGENNKYDGDDFSKHFFSVCPEFYLNYKISPRSVFRTKIDYARTLGDIVNFLISPVQTDLTTRHISSGILTDNKRFLANAHYDYKIPLNMWFFHVDFIYENNKYNQLLSQEVESDMIILKNISLPNRANNIKTEIGLTKRLQSINTKLTLNFSYLWKNEDIMQNEQLIGLTSRRFAANPSVSSNPLKWLELDYGGTFYKTSSQYLSLSKSYLSQNHLFNIKIFPINPLQLQISTDVTKREFYDETSKTIALFDCAISYRYKAIKLDLKLNNILNEKKFSYTIYNAINTYTYDYKLRGREFLFAISFTR